MAANAYNTYPRTATFTLPSRRGPVKFWELKPDSPKMAWSPEANQATVSYLVQSDPSYAYREALLGWVIVTAKEVTVPVTAIKKALLRFPPHRHPHPVTEKMFAIKILADDPYVTKGGKDDFGVSRSKWRRLSVMYTRPSYDIDSDFNFVNPTYHNLPDEAPYTRRKTRYLTIRKEDKFFALPYRAGSWVWKADPLKTVPSEIQIPLPRQAFKVTWHNIPAAYFPHEIWLNMVGKVNATTMLDCEPGTLLCYPGQDEPTVIITGDDDDRGLNATANFVYAPQGWNWYPRPDKNNDFWEVSNRAGTDGPFPSGEFANMFRPV